MSERPSKGRWFQFSLRAMLLGVTLLALCIGWVEYQRRWIGRRHALGAAEDGRIVERFGTAGHDQIAHGPGLLWLFGEPGRKDFQILVDAAEPSGITDEDRKRAADAKRLFPETTVYFLSGGDESNRIWVIPAK